MSTIPEKPQLQHVLSLFDLSMLSSASMGPAYSLASTMGFMVAAAGALTPLALCLLALCMACIAISYANLSQRYPNAGSSYAWILQAFGARVGALGAWILLMANIFAVLATAIPAGTYTLALLKPELVHSPLWVAIVGALWVIFSGALLAAGLRPTAGVTAVLLIGELVVLAASAVAAWLHPAVSVIATHQHSAVLSVNPWPGLGMAMVLAIWVVDGWELSAATSEEANSTAGPGRSGLLALAAITVSVLVSMVAYLHFIAPSDFVNHQTDAMALVGERLGGWWIPTIVGTVLISTSASLWTTMLYLTRSLFAMGRDGVIAAWFAKLDVDATPRRALVLVTLGSAALTLLGGALPSVAEALALALSGSGVFLGLIFVATAFAALKLVGREHGWLSGVGAPLFGALSIGALSVAQIFSGELKLRLFALIAILLGVPFALWRARRMRI